MESKLKEEVITGPLTEDKLRRMDAYWRAANYLSVGQIYLLDNLFTTDKPFIFAYHGYPWLVHQLAYRRTNHKNLHVRGYKEESTTTTPFDMLVMNDMGRYNLANDVIQRVPKLGYTAAYVKQALRDKLVDHKKYIIEYGEDMPETRNWRWSLQASESKIAV